MTLNPRHETGWVAMLIACGTMLAATATVTAAALTVAAAAPLSVDAELHPQASPATGAVSAKNLILITIDTLRADRLSAYGYRRPTSPNMDRFMARGVRFEWAFSSASYTAPSHISLMTGLYPSFTSVMLDNGRFFKLSGKTTTLAELCRDKGMRTAAVVSNPTLNRRLGLHQGFPIYSDLQFDRAHERYLPKDASITTQEAIEILDQIHDAPFFMWIHYQDPHGPYSPPIELQTFGEPPIPGERDTLLDVGTDTSGYKSIPTYQVMDAERAVSQYSLRYDNEILYLDRQIQALFDRFEKLLLYDNTLIVLTSDHGEAFSEDQFYFAHSHSVGLDQVHVPLAVAGAGCRSNGLVKAPVGAVDVFATMTEALGVQAGAKATGRSLSAVLRGEAELPEKPVFCESFSQRGVVMNGMYYRADRRPPESPIWKVSPTSNGKHLPLGPQLIRLADGAAMNASQGAGLSAELDAFAVAAEEAIRTTFDELIRRVREDRTIAENNGLVFFRDQLGYAFDLKDLEPVKVEELSAEEKAQRRALKALGYRDDEEPSEDKGGSAGKGAPSGKGESTGKDSPPEDQSAAGSKEPKP
ncbi:MAG: sulfatase [Phycisphaerales bacterium]|nr:sulfatase [Phycisphaerales bacterium]